MTEGQMEQFAKLIQKYNGNYDLMIKISPIHVWGPEIANLNCSRIQVALIMQN